MKNPGTKPARARSRAPEDERVRQAVDVILKKLKRGQKVVLPGLGSLLPGAPPSFRSTGQRKAAQSPDMGKAGDERS
ncbi:MAG TPA: hypothetical protein PLZ95_12770 [Bryobacteraceae bacterium]|nr:hypothetical protein [Bryobacteraceae bacterium]